MEHADAYRLRRANKEFGLEGWTNDNEDVDIYFITDITVRLRDFWGYNFPELAEFLDSKAMVGFTKATKPPSLVVKI